MNTDVRVFEPKTQAEKASYEKGFRAGRLAEMKASTEPAYEAGYREGIMVKFREVCREHDRE